MHQGSCLCGAVKFTVSGSLGKGSACHCQQCRQWTGNFYVDTEVQREQLTIEDEGNQLKWFDTSHKVRRGFCGRCGSSLFFDPIDKEKHCWIGIALGAFTTPTNTEIGLHIFVGEKGDYYEINDGAPQNEF